LEEVTQADKVVFLFRAYYRQTVCRKMIILEDIGLLQEDRLFILEAKCSIKASYENPRGTPYDFA
jgi:hypothetical protein